MAKKQLTKYKVLAAGSWTIIPAISEELAKAEMADRLGYKYKQYLWDRIKVVPATENDVERYAEMVDVGPRKRDGRNVVREKLDG